MANIREVRRKGGRAFEVRWRVNATFKQRTFTARRDAERFALRVENEIADGGSTDLLQRRGRTVAEVIEASLLANAPTLKMRTTVGYRSIYNRRIPPEFGARRVASVTRADVQSWLARLSAEGLSAATVHHHYIALKKAFRHAQNDRLIVHNPCDGIRVSSKASEDFRPIFLDASQVAQLSDELDRQHPYGLLVRFAAWTGLRAAEVVGLRICDVDLTAGHVDVRRTLDRFGGKWRVGTPKSARSTRKVPLLNRTLRAELREYVLAHPHSGDPEALFWPGRTVGSAALDWDGVLDIRSFRRNYFGPALVEAGMEPMRFHDLRHTFASLLLDAGYEPRKVSHWMGHANLNTTDTIYGHLYPSNYEHEVARMDSYLSRELGSS